VPAVPVGDQERGERARPAATDEDDGTPYGLAEALERKCPACTWIVAAEAEVCDRCGVNLKTGKKPPRVYQALEKRWEAGLPLSRRLRLFLIAQAVFVPLGLFGAYTMGSLWLYLTPWVGFTALLAFLLGTFDRVDLSRTSRGKVHLARTWRVCFWELQPVSVRLAEYEGVVTGKFREVDFWDWLVLLTLLSMGLIPGLLWWHFAFRHATFFVALSKDHGYPELTLYRGWNETQMKDMARVLREVGEYPG
jgi:hypothetical protein